MEKREIRNEEMLDKNYEESALSISMLKKWFIELRCRRTSANDAEC